MTEPQPLWLRPSANDGGDLWRLGVNNARHEDLNRHVRLIINRAYGFHSANAALALVMVTLGLIEYVLPHERVLVSDAQNRDSSGSRG